MKQRRCKASRASRAAVRRTVIHAAAKPEIRDMLDLNHIHERMLFPGVAGLWLRRYLSPALDV